MRTADLARELLSVSSVLTMKTAVKDIRRRKHGTQFYRHTKVNSAAAKLSLDFAAAKESKLAAKLTHIYSCKTALSMSDQQLQLQLPNNCCGPDSQ